MHSENTMRYRASFKALTQPGGRKPPTSDSTTGAWSCDPSALGQEQPCGVSRASLLRRGSHQVHTRQEVTGGHACF